MIHKWVSFFPGITTNQFCGKTQSERLHIIPSTVTFTFSDFSAISRHYNAKEDQITVLWSDA